MSVLVLMAGVAGAPARLMAQGPPPCPGGEADPCQCSCKSFFTPLDPVRTFYASADLVGLMRDVEDDPIEFATRGAGGPAALGTEDFEEDFQGGIRITLGQTLSERFRLEGTYFGLHKWTEESAVRNEEANSLGGTGNLFSPFTNFGKPAVQGLDYNNFASIDIESRMDNVELNLRHCLPMPSEPLQMSIIYGIRWMNIAERFGYLTQSDFPAADGATNSVTTFTNNDLIGFQIGGQTQIRVEERWWFDIDLKGALCTNRARQDTTYVQTLQGAATTYAGRGQRDVTAFIGDISIMLNYEITPHLRTRLGYQAVFVTEVALAAEQFTRDINTLTLGPAELDHKGVVVYHGPSAGITLTW